MTTKKRQKPRHTDRDDKSGKYKTGLLCDACNKPTGTAYHTDDEVCGTSDGPGFTLCDRARCRASYAGMDVEARRTMFTAAVAERASRFGNRLRA